METSWTARLPRRQAFLGTLIYSTNVTEQRSRTHTASPRVNAQAAERPRQPALEAERTRKLASSATINNNNNNTIL